MENRDYRRHTATTKKKPVMVNLTAAGIACLVAFIIGFAISSVALVNSRVADREEKIAELEGVITSKDEEIKSLNADITKKTEDNIVLAEKIALHEDTIENLKIDPTYTPAGSSKNTSDDSANIITSFSQLTTSQMLIMTVLLFVVLIFIVSVTCGIISVSNNGKKKKSKKHTEHTTSAPEYDDSALPPLSDYENGEAGDFESAVSGLGSDESAEEYTPDYEPYDPIVEEAIDLLYHNNLEDNVSELGGFAFGITNFDEILSDKAKGKSFGNAENGDFIAFMAVKAGVKKLYIIPRYLTLSDSSVALRGTTDLFSVVDESGNEVTHGTVNIKSVNSPAVFALGETGWAIESKGSISSYGYNSI